MKQTPKKVEIKQSLAIRKEVTVDIKWDSLWEAYQRLFCKV